MGRSCRMHVNDACKVLVGEPKGKRPLRRPRYEQEDNLRIALKE